MKPVNHIMSFWTHSSEGFNPHVKYISIFHLIHITQKGKHETFCLWIQSGNNIYIHSSKRTVRHPPRSAVGRWSWSLCQHRSMHCRVASTKFKFSSLSKRRAWTASSNIAKSGRSPDIIAFVTCCGCWFGRW